MDDWTAAIQYSRVVIGRRINVVICRRGFMIDRELCYITEIGKVPCLTVRNSESQAVNPLTPTVVTAIKHLVPDRVKS